MKLVINHPSDVLFAGRVIVFFPWLCLLALVVSVADFSQGQTKEDADSG